MDGTPLCQPAREPILDLLPPAPDVVLLEHVDARNPIHQPPHGVRCLPCVPAFGRLYHLRYVPQNLPHRPLPPPTFRAHRSRFRFGINLHQ
jgi:hypothetical protein